MSSPSLAHDLCNDNHGLNGVSSTFVFFPGLDPSLRPLRGWGSFFKRCDDGKRAKV